ncbi:phosphotransferase [Knoellia sp. CPCC 206450]|uniref:macrolide 2'-phosphotransferase n=1 Tax=Knoellia tibetensis TaxID=3404798 RepID=UPI003B433F19
MERTPTFLAALASAGVPGLDPVSVEALPSVPDQDYDVAFVQDSEHRRWVVRAPRSEAAGARMDLTVTLLQMLARRLPFTIPSPRGFVELKGGGRAMIYPYLPGHNLAFDELPPGPGPAAELGRALAALHNTDVRLFDEAGMPTYDTDSYRRRRLTELDRAAESGRVPTALLARWEHALEDVALWRFAPTCVHGDLTGGQVLAVFEDDSDSSTGRIRGITGWEDAKVADPADDFAAIVDEADPAALETVLEAYAHARVERPDANLVVRARLASELGILAELMRADARGDAAAVEGLSARLRRLDDEVHAEQPGDDYHRGSLTPVALRSRTTPPPVVADEDEDDTDIAPPTVPSTAGSTESGSVDPGSGAAESPESEVEDEDEDDGERSADPDDPAPVHNAAQAGDCGPLPLVGSSLEDDAADSDHSQPDDAEPGDPHSDDSESDDAPESDDSARGESQGGSPGGASGETGDAESDASERNETEDGSSDTANGLAEPVDADDDDEDDVAWTPRTLADPPEIRRGNDTDLTDEELPPELR